MNKAKKKAPGKAYRDGISLIRLFEMFPDTMSQILDTTLFEKMTLNQLFTDYGCRPEPVPQLKQLQSFDF